ncbi:hypothetical protein [uncultured Duncaniella sp.]|uniref:hypothetical protein n=1 Tax=uncultured Duncaniella sp. TaxID=2768039 RepID=UPI0025F6E9D8|nr:hypothetical protein [uncultured Duncaniella sp.]
MLFSLSSSRIADIIHAYSALELLSLPDGEVRALLAPLFDKEHPEPLRLMIENSFSELTLDLLPFIDNDDPLPAEPADPQLLQLNLRLPASSASLATHLRRRMEMIIADRVFESALNLLVIPNISSSSASLLTIAENYRQHHTASLSTLLSSLRSPARPFVRKRGY